MTSATETKPTEAHPSGEHHPGRWYTQPLSRGSPVASWIGMVIVAAIVAGGRHLRNHGPSRKRAHLWKRRLPPPPFHRSTSSIPTTSTLSSELALPGNTQAFTDTPIYSRTNGYLKNWYFDIGAHVRKGQLMAEIETPSSTSSCRSHRPI